MTTATAPTSTAAVAEELVSFCRAGKNLDAINSFYAPDIVSIESMGNETMPRELRGIDAVRGKNQWWSEHNEVHSATAPGPFIGPDDTFAVYYSYAITAKQDGKRNRTEEMALYAARAGTIARA